MLLNAFEKAPLAISEALNQLRITDESYKEVSHASSRDMSEPTFCPWKTVVSTPQPAEVDVSSGKSDTQDTTPNVQTYSANSGLDLLSNIAFLSGIIDSPTQFSCPSPKDEKPEQTQTPISEISVTEGRALPEVSHSPENMATSYDTSQKNVLLDNSKATANYKSEGSSLPSEASASATVAKSQSQIQSKINEGSDRIQMSLTTHSTVGQTTHVASGHQYVNTVANTAQQMFTATSHSSNGPLSHPVLDKRDSSGTYPNMLHNGPDTSHGYPFPLFPNISHIAAHNAFQFPFANIPHSQARGQVSPDVKEENRLTFQVPPWMFPVPTNLSCHPVNTIMKHPPVSVQNWLADSSSTSRNNETTASTSQQYTATPTITNTSATVPTCFTSSRSSPMFLSHQAPRPIFTGTVQSTPTRYTSSAPTPVVISRAKESSVSPGRDDKTVPGSGSSVFPEWFAASLYPSSVYQQTPVRAATSAMDSPISDVDSAPDSAFCSPDSCDDSSHSLDVTNNSSDRSTPSSGIQSVSSSIQNISPGSSSDHSNQSSLSESTSSIFGRPADSVPESPSPTSFNHELPLFEQSLPVSTQTLVKRERANQDPNTATSALFGQQTVAPAVSAPERSETSVICPDVTDQTKKKSRTNYTPAQVRSLERVFLDTPYPESQVMEDLSKNLNIPEQKLKVWFQNKRARWRRRVQENKVPPVHPLFMTPQSAYGMMRPPSAPGPFFPYPGHLTSSSTPRPPCPSFPPAVQCPPQMNSYMLQQF
ncbi:mucin-5AC-like [Gigantopelta aegis]|uniref:mucin-5AC-like n=1 Tax=Gigantopelta aegis TaxID=1735272 RepID=UPI001B88B755|nr:mucin-5AC-like [Gigantopelta aegis]